MRIFGDAVWYRPSWLDPVYQRFRLSHGAGPAAECGPEAGDGRKPIAAVAD
ncbi:hypothetical protein MYK68_18440 [Gordonia sp. PP30]|nr:hypothetical protein [Gordonia sp. PP30]UQE74664.1 hypothetical protein MYK68_18440 [Gordonia sp. PP30]